MRAILDCRGLAVRLTVVLSAMALMIPWDAEALTLNGFKGQGLEAIYGSYAPRGDCEREPRLTIAEAGFTFRAAGRTVTSTRFEHALTFMGPSYEGISSVFFPFPVNSGNMGPIIMIVNDDEKRGVIRIEADIPPARRLDPFHAALTAGSPFLLCKGTAQPLSRAPAPVPAAPAAPMRAGVPLDWKALPTAAGKYPGDIDLFGTGQIAIALRSLLGPKLAVLERAMNVTGPLRRQGSIYYLSGNAPHRGGMDQAYILMDAARRTVEVGLWEKGKLTVHSATGTRMAPPAEIAQMLMRSPPETAIPAPGLPWETRPLQGRTPLAFVSAAASPDIQSFSLFCDKGRPTLAMLLNKSSRTAPLSASWVFAGGIVTVPMARGNQASTFWLGGLTGSTLPRMLVREKGSVYFRINGEMQGEALLTGSTVSVRTALASCYRF